MTMMEDLELLKAAIALACTDGELRRSEMGVIEGLALRVGVELPTGSEDRGYGRRRDGGV